MAPKDFTISCEIRHPKLCGFLFWIGADWLGSKLIKVKVNHCG